MQGTLFSPDFNRSVVVEARPERLSSDAGALLIRDLTERPGLPALAGKHLDDPRDRDRTRHPFLELLLHYPTDIMNNAISDPDRHLGLPARGLREKAPRNRT